MKRVIPYGKHQITWKDILAVIKVLKSDYLTQGPSISEFEDAFSEYIGVKHSCAVSNGTAALHLAILALGINKGDKVITTPISFSATANCIRYAGGEVIFADINKDDFLIDPESIVEILEKSPKGSVKGIIPVDFAGRPVQMERIREIANEHNCWVLEDACHAPGGHFISSSGEVVKCGNGQYADLSIFSFHPVKHIASGEGGMICTNNTKLFEKLTLLRTHGISRNQRLFRNSLSVAYADKNKLNTEDQNYPGWYYEMLDLGYNYRLTDFQAALGKSQLRRADRMLQKRVHIANEYYNAFRSSEFIINQSGIIPGHAYHLYIIEVKNREGLYKYLRDKGIYAQVHYVPIHLMPYYSQYGWKPGDFPIAENYYKHCLSLPMYPSLRKRDLDYVIRSIKEFYNAQ